MEKTIGTALGALASAPGLRLWAAMVLCCCLFITAANFIDMWSGIDAARAARERIDSRGLRRTVSKIIDYFRVLLFAAMVDALGMIFPWYALPYAMVLVTAGVLAIECRSVMENARKKKSHAALLSDVVRQIIACADEKDARRIVDFIKGKNLETSEMK